MSIQLRETGWQPFLDRLKKLLGKSGDPDLPAAAASATGGHGASASASGTPRLIGRMLIFQIR